MPSSRAEYPSLLLLPAPPTPSSRSSLNAAYRSAISAAVSNARSPEVPATLIVALASRVLTRPFPRVGPNGRTQVTRAIQSWFEAQSLLAGLYSLIAAVCAEQAVPGDIGAGPGSVDVRVVLVHHDDAGAAGRVGTGFGLSSGSAGGFSSAPVGLGGKEPNGTPVVDLQTFASAYHPWNLIMHPDGEGGYRLQGALLRHAEGKQVILQSQLVAVRGGVSLNVSSFQEKTQPSQSAPGPSHSDSYDVVCLGGTFDHLHPGHKLLLTAAVLLLDMPDNDEEVVEGEETSTTPLSPCRLIVGITGDALLKNKKFAEQVQSWDERAGAVLDFVATLLELQREGWKAETGPAATTGPPRLRPSSVVKREPGDVEAAFRSGAVRVQCVEIQDAFGPTITDESVKALVVSGETRSGGQAVNDRRGALGWKELDVYEVDVLDARELADEGADGDGREKGVEDFSAKISSTAIREQRAKSTPGGTV